MPLNEAEEAHRLAAWDRRSKEASGRPPGSEKMLHWNSRATSKYESNPAMMSLVLLLLSETQAFLNRAFTFVSEKYDNLTCSSKFTKVQAWSLTMRLFKRVWVGLYRAKMAFFSDIELSDRQSTAATILWTTMRSMKVALGYMECDITNHPGISTAYVEFLSVRSGTEEIGAMRTELNGHTSRIKTLEKDVKESRAKADSGTTKAQEVLNTAKATAKNSKKKSKTNNNDDE